MENIIWSGILMLFLLWCYKILSQNFQTPTPLQKEKNSNSSEFSIKKFLLLLGIFFVCFLFIKLNNVSNKVVNRSTTAASTVNEVNTQFSSMASPPNEPSTSIELLQAHQIKTKFSDVAGLLEPKEEVSDIIHFLKAPQVFSKLGAKSPKGLLMYGPPGTGKTLLARAIAGEAGVSFIAISGSHFDEEYVGVGAARVRELFKKARKNAPCIIFIDELDSLAYKRNSKHAPPWTAQTVNQLLAEMDGLNEQQNEGIILIGASNRIDALDPAVLRPGRFDRHVKLELPTLEERKLILKLHAKKVTLDPNLDLDNIAKMTPGFSSADLANLVNEAALYATKTEKSAIGIQDFETAKDKIILGLKRSALILDDKEKKLTAYHEAGHALVGSLQPAHDPIYKVTISPRGPSLGHTSFEPEQEYNNYTLAQLEAQIATCLAGRLAEEMIFGTQEVTTGASNDFKNATSLANMMVTKWGFSKKIGTIYIEEDSSFADDNVIREEIRFIINKANQKAKTLLEENKDKLHKLASALLEYETLDQLQIKKLLTEE